MSASPLCPDCCGTGSVPPFMDPCPCAAGPIAPAAAPTGVPLADGTIPKVGDTVQSLRDGLVGRIVQTDLRFGAKHRQDPRTFVRVRFDGETPTIRSRRTLVHRDILSS